MTKYPNRDALYAAYTIYRDAMRRFIIRCLNKHPDATLEELINNALGNIDNEIEAAIDITHFPEIIRKHWTWKSYDLFRKEFDSDSNIRSEIELIKNGRQHWAHPGLKDTDRETTRVLLFLIAAVLDKINEPDEKREVEAIHDRLYPDDSKQDFGTMSNQLQTTVAEQTALVEKREEIFHTFEVGRHGTGVVKNVTTFGAFVDLGGADGLIHKSEMALAHIEDPSEVISVGEEIEVRVTKIDRENKRISLSLKPAPWENVEEKYPVGSVVQVTIVNIVSYGAFVQLEAGVEGLIHVSEMSWTRLKEQPSQLFNQGDKIDAVVLEISKEDERISLDLKQLQQHPWKLFEQKYPIGTQVTGHVVNLTDFGVSVEIEESFNGLIRTFTPELLRAVDEVEAFILDVDVKKQHISLYHPTLSE